VVFSYTFSTAKGPSAPQIYTPIARGPFVLSHPGCPLLIFSAAVYYRRNLPGTRNGAAFGMGTAFRRGPLFFPMTEYLCNGFECECGARVRVCRNDRSKPMPPSESFDRCQHSVPDLRHISSADVERRRSASSCLDREDALGSGRIPFARVLFPHCSTLKGPRSLHFTDTARARPFLGRYVALEVGSCLLGHPAKRTKGKRNDPHLFATLQKEVCVIRPQPRTALRAVRSSSKGFGFPKKFFDFLERRDLRMCFALAGHDTYSFEPYKEPSLP